MTPTRLGSVDCETVINRALAFIELCPGFALGVAPPAGRRRSGAVGVEPKNYDKIVIKSLTLLLSPEKKASHPEQILSN
jgi:hypothetical protein